jgi:Eukaryotic cytochrome b561
LQGQNEIPTKEVPTMAVPKKSSGLTSSGYWAIVAFAFLYSLAGGYYAGIQPASQWRYFSWHPVLMTLGMVGFSSVGAVTKKLGGYTNTKSHAILSWGSIIVSMTGLYCIYTNKERNGLPHLKSYHALFGVAVMASCFGLGMVGSIVLHPDFGVDKTNKVIRRAHKLGARATLLLGWVTAVYGFYQLAPSNYVGLVLYSLPLVGLAPLVLL